MSNLRNQESGISLIEAIVSIILLAFALTSLIALFSNVSVLAVQGEFRNTSDMIAQEFVEEILTRRFDELSVKSGGNWSVIGVDSGENATDMTTFDDIDDFDGWSESLGWPYAGFTRSALVIYVADSDLDVASTRDKNYKRVNVQVSNNAVTYSTVVTIATPIRNSAY